MIQTEPNAAAAAAVSANRNIVIRPADADEAGDLFRLIADNVETGHLLPRSAGRGRTPRATVSRRRHRRWGHRVHRAGPVRYTGRRSAVARRCRAASPSGGGYASAQRDPRDGPAPGIPHALCVRTRPAAVRPAGFLDRAPPVGTKEDHDRLPHVCLVPALRAVRGDLRSQAEGRSLIRMRVGHHE